MVEKSNTERKGGNMGRTMRGVVFTGDGTVTLQEFPIDDPKGTQVLISVRAAGLCGSDMHSYREPPEHWGQYPVVRGHEPAGIVEDVGEAVTMVKPGDRVSVYHAPACGHCEPCLNGEYFRCTTIGPGYRLASLKVHGCDADYLLVDQNVCFPLPDELSYEDGAIIACAGGTAYHALTLADVHAYDAVLVSGLGPVGLCVAHLAVAMGAIVIGADPIEYRRSLATEIGAKAVYNPLEVNAQEFVEGFLGEGADKAVETSGNDQARAEIIPATHFHGRLVYVGVGGKEKNVELGPSSLGERWISGSNIFTGADYYRLIRLMRRSGLRFADLVTHRFPLEKGQEAFDLFETGETGKVMFVMADE
jgi:threonine dehydrogenase-like Zn-dependent dehydrogenase